MMKYIKETSDISYSKSRCLKFMGQLIFDEKGRPMEGERKMSDGSLMRFKGGLIHGGNFPAIEYENGGTEYWQNGFPHGNPAVITDYGARTETWEKGQLLKIESEMEIIKILGE